VGPMAGLDGRKNLVPHQDSIPVGTVQPVAQSLYRLSYPAHTKLYLSDLKTQSVPRSKHSVSVIKNQSVNVV